MNASSKKKKNIEKEKKVKKDNRILQLHNI
jgi:hypothetical protein